MDIDAPTTSRSTGQVYIQDDLFDEPLNLEDR